MDSTLACLVDWMPRQRWYSSKDRSPRLRLLTVIDHPSADRAPLVRVLIVADEAAQPVVVYQVPVVTRREPLGDPANIIGRIGENEWLIDGPHDDAYTASLWRQLSARESAAPPVPRARVLDREQSNTSIVYAAPAPVICKVFRQLHAGVNPDIELQTVLATYGTSHIARFVGSVDGDWSARLGGPAEPGSLAFAQEFLSDSEDAWHVAQRAARAGASFHAAARELGEATAEVHLALSRALPIAPADERSRHAAGATWRRRLEIAMREVPALAPHAEAIANVYAGALEAAWPPLQRVHGDLHLGQVLHAGPRGWILLDFEGEPLRPIEERRRPDIVLRDVAGMLRSFDYVAGALRRSDPTASDVEAWAADARRGFLQGYESRTDRPLAGPLLDACELDKAVYEAIYESRNRPTWLDIPLDAVDRLLASR